MSDNFGVTPQGFKRRRLPELKSQLEELLRQELPKDGPDDELDLSPESLLGQIVGVFTKPLADSWEALESIYHSQYRGSASASSLDGVAFNLGITRLAATSTVVAQSLIGNEGTNVPAGSEVQHSVTSEVFTNREAVTITASRMDVAIFNVPAVASGTEYSVQINGTTFAVTAGNASTPASIAQGLSNRVQSGGEPVGSVSSGDSFTVTSDEGFDAFGASTSAGVVIAEISTPQLFYSQQQAPIDATSGTVNKIQTPVLGWQRTVNRRDGRVGRLLESDSELRRRTQESIRKIGGSSVTAIRSQILDLVPGVTAVTIGENRSDVADDLGRPPHSFEAVVQGGEDQRLADVIWLAKPAGIETHGNQSRQIVDEAGNGQRVNYSRPVERYVWIEVEVNRYSEEEYPVNGNELVADEILAFGQGYEIGEDVIRQRLHGPIHNVPGISFANVRLAVTDDANTPPNTFKEENCPIGPVEIAVFDRPRISVRVVAE